MRKIIIALAILSFVLNYSITYSQSCSEKSAILNALIDNDRFMKDQLIPEQHNSPFATEQLTNFSGLKYFDVDSKWRVFSRLQRDEFQEEIDMKVSDGKSKRLLRYGTLSFSLNGSVYSLSVFRDQNLSELAGEPGCLFVPFLDGTSGYETYIGGRYLIVKIPMNGEEIELDFNKAINPFCAYNTKNSSILAPHQNRIPIRITSGEKCYK